MNNRNNQESIVPTKCAVCGCDVFFQYLTDVKHVKKTYYKGKLINTEERGDIRAKDSNKQYQCGVCGEYVDGYYPSQQDDVPELTLHVEKDTVCLSSRAVKSSLLTRMYILHPVGLCTGDKHHYKIRDFESWDAFRTYLVTRREIKIIKPLYYRPRLPSLSYVDYSYNETCYQIGYIFVTATCARKRHLFEKRDIEEVMLEEVDRYNRYLQGLIWRYVISDEEGQKVTTMGGFYSEDEAYQAGERKLRLIKNNEFIK